MKKIAMVASSGGHWEELMQLSKTLGKYDVFYVTEKGGQADDSDLKQIYLFDQVNRREIFFLIHFVWIVIKSLAIMLKEKPDVVVTTGALIAFPFCLIAKIQKKKVIYIESFARVNEPSLTGRLVYRFADLFIVQWKSMLKCFPKAKYAGGIF